MKRIYLVITSICLIFIFTNCSSKEDDLIINPLPSLPVLNKTDSIAMVNIYNKIGPWGNEWDLSNIQTWGGVTIALDISKNEYRIIEFNYNGSFKGEIPNDFLQLKELRVLGLGGGSLYGTIPAWIGDLDKLEYLYIAYNEISGSIPSSIGKLKNLRALSLGENNLSGFLPEELGDLESLESLNIMDTNIEGVIPSSLKNLTKIERIILENNKLSGEFPIEILNSKFVIMCKNNYITKLDFNVWSDKNNLFPPDLQRNRLLGTIPDSIKTNKKWETYKFFVGNQQDGYGYQNF